MLTMLSKKRKNKDKNKNSSQELLKKCSVYYIPCDLIRSNAMRSRCDFDEDKLIALAYSIKRYGIIEPLCVKETDEDDSYEYEIITGERRIRAAKLAELRTVPCIIISAEQEYSAELSLVENLYFEPLNYFESAVALQRIVKYSESAFDELALRLDIPQADLTKKLWLLELDYDERQALLNLNVSEEIAVSIAKIPDKALRKQIIDVIAYESSANVDISSRVEELKREKSTEHSLDIPRDVASVVRGISSRISFLNRRKKRAKLDISRTSDSLIARISIKL